MKSGRRSLLAFGITAGVLTVAAAAIAIPGFGKMAILDRENQARERLRSGTGATPGYILVASPLGKQAVPEVYGETGRYTFFTHPEHGVLKLDRGGKPVDRIPSDEELGIRRAPRK